VGGTGDLPLKKELTGGRLCARMQTMKAARIRISSWGKATDTRTPQNVTVGCARRIPYRE